MNIYSLFYLQEFNNRYNAKLLDHVTTNKRVAEWGEEMWSTRTGSNRIPGKPANEEEEKVDKCMRQYVGEIVAVLCAHSHNDVIEQSDAAIRDLKKFAIIPKVDARIIRFFENFLDSKGNLSMTYSYMLTELNYAHNILGFLPRAGIKGLRATLYVHPDSEVGNWLVKFADNLAMYHDYKKRVLAEQKAGKNIKLLTPKKFFRDLARAGYKAEEGDFLGNDLEDHEPLDL